jgi:hypothetical protein
MIQAAIGSVRVISGRTISRTLASTAASDQGAFATKCSRDWC